MRENTSYREWLRFFIANQAFVHCAVCRHLLRRLDCCRADIWPEPWVLPFSTKPLGELERQLHADKAKESWPIVQRRWPPNGGISAPMNLTGATLFSPIEIEEEDWHLIVRDLGFNRLTKFCRRRAGVRRVTSRRRLSLCKDIAYLFCRLQLLEGCIAGARIAQEVAMLCAERVDPATTSAIRRAIGVSVRSRPPRASIVARLHAASRPQ